MTEKAVVLEELTKKFGSFTAVDSVSLTVNRGEIFGFLGANGAGKSTTIRMLCGILKPTSGTGLVGGVDISLTPEKVKKFIGYMSQRFSLYDDLTIRENLEFYSGIYLVPRREEVIQEALVQAGLAGRENRLTGSLPPGWKQQLSLAAAVMHRPEILFLDEPTSGVDPNTRRRFWGRIRELADRGATVFVTTHYMMEAEYCHRLSIMKEGRVMAIGTPEELRSRWQADSLEEVFIAIAGSSEK